MACFATDIVKVVRSYLTVWLLLSFVDGGGLGCEGMWRDLWPPCSSLLHSPALSLSIGGAYATKAKRFERSGAGARTQTNWRMHANTAKPPKDQCGSMSTAAAAAALRPLRPVGRFAHTHRTYIDGCARWLSVWSWCALQSLLACLLNCV